MPGGYARRHGKFTTHAAAPVAAGADVPEEPVTGTTVLFELRQNSKTWLFDSRTVRPSVVGPADGGMSGCC